MAVQALLPQQMTRTNDNGARGALASNKVCSLLHAFCCLPLLFWTIWRSKDAGTTAPPALCQANKQTWRERAIKNYHWALHYNFTSHDFNWPKPSTRFLNYFFHMKDDSPHQIATITDQNDQGGAKFSCAYRMCGPLRISNKVLPVIGNNLFSL